MTPIFLAFLIPVPEPRCDNAPTKISFSKISYHKMSISDPNSEKDAQNESEGDMSLPDTKMGANESKSSPQLVVAKVSNSPEETKLETVVNITDAKTGLNVSKNSPEPVIAEGPEPIEENSKPEEQVPKKKLCGVCKEKEGKYKCSRCYLP